MHKVRREAVDFHWGRWGEELSEETFVCAGRVAQSQHTFVLGAKRRGEWVRFASYDSQTRWGDWMRTGIVVAAIVTVRREAFVGIVGIGDLEGW